ncbi:MAG: primase-helicase family protein [Gammaproteobacteria bacterium]
MPTPDITRAREKLRQAAPSMQTDGLRDKALDDFYHYAPDNRCIYLPTGEMWACASADMAIKHWPKNPQGEAMKPSRWLARNRAVDQITWHPGRPQVQSGVSVRDGGYVVDDKTRVFNLYRPPLPLIGDPAKAGPWIDHVNLIYPDTADHIIAWLAHRVQRPGEKINHALVLGGDQGIGKDTLLEPVKVAVGPWNWSEISPGQMLGRFNGWAKAVIVRVSEARDLGDTDRFAFYDHSKTYIAAPPDVLRVDEKNIREHAVFNVCGVIITTNHRTDGIYLPLDDRRHHVSWSDTKREQFSDAYWRDLWGWFERGGIGHVCAYLHSLDLSGFNPKAPPFKTRAFMAIVQANQAPEDAELADLLDAIDNPLALCIESLVVEAHRMDRHDLAEMLTNVKSRRSVPHKMERVGYETVNNPDAADGLFKINGRRRRVYARRGVNLSDQIRAARGITHV